MKNTLLCKCLTLLASNSNKKNTTRFNGLLALFLMVMGMGVSWGQTTIASDGLNNSTSLFTLSGGAYYTGNSASGDRPATSAFASEGSHSRGVINGTATLTSSDINTTGYSSIQMTVRVAAFSIGSTTNGVDGTDILTVEVSPNGGTNYYSTCRILGNSNAYWAYGATGNASTAYDGDATPVDITPTGGGSRTTDGYSTMTITGLPSSTNMKIKITMLNNATGEQWVIDDFKVTGTATATPSIAISNGTIAAGSPNNGQTNVVLQRYDMAVTTANATLTGLTVTTAGTYAATDLTNLKCWYQSSSTFNSGTATLLSTKTTSLSSGSQVFPSFTSQTITSGSTGYIFVTADIASGATNGNTINIGTTAFSNITFSSGTKTGTDPVPAGGAQTITVAVPDIALSSPAASAANITVGTTNNVIYRFDLAITTATPSLTGVTINTSTGSNVSGDLTNLKCWYQTSSTFNAGTATLLSTKSSSLSAGSQVFPTFSSQSLTSGSTYYIFITADVPLTATPNNTIIVSAVTTSDLTFATGNKTGTANASGTKTFIDCTPNDVTSTAASSANLSSVLTWINPACYDEILIVAALASNNGTPTGDGSAYTSNLAYGSGTALGNGFVVYKGSASSQTVTGLTNGTQYYFKFFTRRGTTWTSGTEVSATPNIAGYYWNGASIAANPAAGGTGTWGAASSWRQPSATGAQATWANGNTAVFAGTAGSVTIDATRVATSFYFNTTGYELINTTTQTLTGPIVLANNVGLTFSPNVNIVAPASGTLNIGSVSGSGTANITINSAQGSATNIAQRLNIATTNDSISVPINITSAGGSGSGTVAAIVGTATGTSLSSAATITNNTAIKTVIGATSGFDITANGVISGSADLMFAAGASGGAGTVTLGAANTYTGATIINAANSGVIKLGVNDALPTGTNVTFGYSSGNGGSLDLNGKNQTLASIINGGFGSSANKIFNNGATDATLTINGSTSPTAFVFGIQDGTTNKILLVKAGSGTLILDGSTTTSGNTYTGLTTVSGGTLRLNKSGGTTIPVVNSVTVSGGTLQVSTNQTLNNLTLTSGTVIIDAGVTLTINGTITRTSGVIQGTATSNLVITGASGTIAFDQTTLGTTNVLKNLTISGSGTTTLGNALYITAGSSSGTVTVGTGATLASAGYLTLKSDANGTARVGNSAGTITGDVTVERYIPAKRAWRALTAPLKGSGGSIYSQWQNGGNVIAGTGVELWSSTGGNGMGTGPSNSILTYNNAGTTGAWNPVTNTNTINLFENNINNAFMVFVTGPYATSSTNISAGSAITTLKATGQLITGTQTYENLPSGVHTLIGNPYACPISPLSLLNGNSSFGNNLWVWDANGAGTYSAGAYNLFDKTTGTTGAYTNITNSTLLSSTPDIQSGQAFFVKASTGTATFSITESNKSTGTSTYSFLRTAAPELFRVGLYKQVNNEWSGRDGAMTVILQDADANQAPNKMANGTENIAFTKNGANFASNHHLPLVATDVLNVKVWNTSAGANYKLKINTEQFTTTNLDATLEDLYTNARTPLSLDGSAVEYPFSVTTDALSTGDRFRIVFQTSTLGTTIPKATGFSIVPNPVTGDSFQVNLGSLATGTYSYSICNAIGQEVEKGSINTTTQNTNYTVKFRETAATGIYIMKIKGSDNSVFTAKLIKK